MEKRKTKNKLQTLTKIDLSTLQPKPFAVSQHAAGSGKCAATITTAINHVQPLAAPLPELVFDVDPLNFAEEYPGDDDGGEDATRGYYVSQVSAFFSLTP